MSQQQDLALRRALFLSGVRQGLEADSLHDFIEDGLRLARVMADLGEKPDESLELREAS